MKKILIVDDNHLSAEGIEKNIDWESLNGEVIRVCYNGSSAIRTMKEEPVDLIISDIEMPDIDGITMSRQALAVNPMVKIILISAYDKFEYARRALLLGALDYIEKPLDYNYLIQKVKKAFDIIEKEKRNLELIRRSRPLLTEKFFQELLNTPRREARLHLESSLEYLNLSLHYSFYNVVVLDMENAQEWKNTYGVESYQVTFLNVQDLLAEHAGAFGYSYILPQFDRYFCILGQNGQQPNHFLQLTYKIISAAVEDCQKRGITLNAGIGSIVTDLWNLSHSCETALHALEYRFFFPHKNVFDGREALGHELSVSDFSEHKEEELIRLLCRKDENAINLWLQEFTRSLSENFHTTDFAFIQIYTLLGRILKFFYELNLDTRELEKSIIHVYNHLDQFRNTDELCAWLKTIFHQVCRKLDSSMNDYHKKLCDVVISYINENYMDNTLCLNDIAGQANVSPAYLSALFSKNQGSSISDFIASRRIEAACQFLSASNMTLKEISARCGYANQYYFSTSFKKRLGISPSAYREAAGQSSLPSAR